MNDDTALLLEGIFTNPRRLNWWLSEAAHGEQHLHEQLTLVCSLLSPHVDVTEIFNRLMDEYERQTGVASMARRRGW